MPARTLLDFFDGWPNLFQGLGSAVVGGVVAALTALLVVKLTHRSDRRLADDFDARSSARALVGSLGQIAGEIEGAIETSERLDRSKLDGLFLRFLVETRIHYGAIALVDGVFWDADINRRIKAVSEKFSPLTGRDGTPLPKTVEEGRQLGDALGNELGDLITVLSTWQLSRSASVRRRPRNSV